ncbi:MAG TPA: hypothetical protein VMV10_12860 [Pirellulales bacterium]|nr:hypothetical protein [Pirellulales bacterium]
MFRERRAWAMICLLGSAISAAAGCSRADVTDYIPTEDAARASLAAALDAWKAGQGPEGVGASEASVNVQDPQWKQGKKLASYEIVGPEPGDDANPRFRVRLSLAGEAAPQETFYVIFGKDPIWVLNEANYRKVSGM